MHNYISRIGCNLHEAIRNRDADLIRSYRRALHSGIARAHETTNREADAWSWDPAVVDGMLQEVEESMATLLPAAEQVSQLGREGSLPCHAGHQPGLRGIRDPEGEQMVSEGLHGVPGGARLGDENLPKDLRRGRHREHACPEAQGSPRQTRLS
jgi:hypothetical protein